jgi:hypothetical protein
MGTNIGQNKIFPFTGKAHASEVPTMTGDGERQVFQDECCIVDSGGTERSQQPIIVN